MHKLRMRAGCRRIVRSISASSRLMATLRVMAMMLYPPVIGITRTALRRTELAGHLIERGTMVVISPYVVHRHRLL